MAEKKVSSLNNDHGDRRGKTPVTPLTPSSHPEAKPEEKDIPEAKENVVKKEQPVFGKIVWHDPSRLSNIPLILFMFFIVVYGLIVLYSVSAPTGYNVSKLTSSAFYVLSQLKFTIAGVALALIVNFIPIEFFKNRFIMYAAYIGSVGIIAATALFGTDAGQGARRWIRIGGTLFQSSEIFKISLVMILAIYRITIINRQKKGKLKASNPRKQPFVDALWEFIIPVGLILLGDGIILMQPHLSCFLIIGVVTVVCFLVSGIRLRSWIIGCGVYLILLMIAIGVVMAVPSAREKVINKVETNFAHVFKRVEIYSQDEEHVQTEQEKDESRQVDRAKDAIGSGGVFGQGIGNSRYKYSYVSEAHNDYIFSIYVEETGMIGGTILILIYLVFLYLGLRVAMRAKDVFCRIVATGYTFLIALEALWNIGVELTVLPPTGITLPFFSYGGTAQILLLAGYGMILCVARSGVVSSEPNERKTESV